MVSTPRRRIGSRLRAVLLAALVAAQVVAVTPVHAGWLSKIGRLADDAGGVGGSALRHGVPGDDFASSFTRHIRAVPGEAEKSAAALAAHATPEGHWRFTNAKGEQFTAANAAEMERAVATLLPENPAAASKLELFLSEDTIFHRPDLVKALPADAKFHLLTAKHAFPLLRSAEAPWSFAALVRPNLRLAMRDRRSFEEALWQLSRPLNRSNMRTIALEPGGGAYIPSVPRVDPATKAALVDRVDPFKLPGALKSLKGQTVVVTGRVDGRTLRFKPEGGAEKTVLIDDLMSAAREADVSLVLLQSDKALQPGGRNWLWQTQEVKGLENALNRATLADFLDALGTSRGGLAIDASESALGRARLDIVPVKPEGAAQQITDSVTGWADSMIGHMLGKVAIEAIKIDAVDRERQRELDNRIVPGIPAWVQWTYLIGIFMGGIGYAWSWRWFARLWPAEDRAEYAGAFGYYAARGVRGLAYVFVFLPIVGIPAGIWAMLVGLAHQIWAGLTAPFRLVRWIGRKLGLASAPAGVEKG